MNPDASSAKAVVFVWDNFGPTHADRMEAVAKALAPRPVVGVELSRKSADYAWESQTGVGFRKMNLPRDGGSWVLKALRIVGTVQKARPAVVFTCHYERLEILAAVIMLRLLGVQIFTMIDSKSDDYQRHMWREVLKRLFLLPYSGAIVGSRRTADYLEFLGLPRDCLLPGYNSISVDRVRRLAGARVAPEGTPFEQRHFTVVARFVPKKNISTVLKAFALIRAKGSRRVLVLCGAGPLEAELRAEAEALGLSDVVRFEGFLQADGVARALGRSLALIQASVEEQFGIAIAEAVAMGVPVLVSDNCGARDSLVRTALNGFVFEPTNVEGLAALMRSLDVDPALWRSLSSGCAPFAVAADVGVFVDSVRRLGQFATARPSRSFAPIAVFAYRRAWHLDRCLTALEQCPEFAQSQVFVFVDGARGMGDEGDVATVRALLERRRRPNMTIIARDTNRGLAQSIIAEVTGLIESHGRVIVFEDDLVVQPSALAWLNQGLDAYEDDARVMQISAWQYRVPEFDGRNTGTFQRFATTWGWATWKRAWVDFDPEAAGWEAVLAPGDARYAFDSGGNYPFSDMLVKQMCGELSSWGIRWSWAVHRNKGLTLMPPRSLVCNEGMDQTATHNSVGWLKGLISGPRSKLWTLPEPPWLPEGVGTLPGEERAFRRGLRRTNALRNARIKDMLSFFGFHVSSARIKSRLRRAIVIAQLPPPLTGLSIVNRHMVESLRGSQLLFEAIDLSPGLVRSAPLKAWVRMRRTMSTGFNLIRTTYRRASTIYLPCDGGLGQIYNMILILFARLGRFELWLHHHSFAYVNRRTRLTAGMLSLCPRETHHVFLCEEMAAKVQRLYEPELQRRSHHAHVLSNAFTVQKPDELAAREGVVSIGCLSNLTVEKGALRFIALFRRLTAAGVPIRAEMAGPAQDAATAEAIRCVVADYPETFCWHGPLAGADKSAFYDRIDAFVFPTAYVNEAQPVVLLEALAHGAAVLACARGCIACDHAAGPGLIAVDEAFDDAAFNWLKSLTAEARLALPAAARRAFDAARLEADSQLADVLAAMKAKPI